MLHLHFQELVTPQLRLRRLGAEDVPVFYSRLASSQNVTKSMLWKPHASLEESAASIQKALRRLEAGESCRWAITLKTTGALIGIIDLLPRDIPKGICSFAYMLAESHWNRGYGTEAMKAVTDFGFAQCGVLLFEADHFADNPASGAVMRKAGMVYCETIPEKYEKNGVRHDAHVYRMTRSDWQMRSKENAFSDNS